MNLYLPVTVLNHGVTKVVDAFVKILHHALHHKFLNRTHVHANVKMLHHVLDVKSTKTISVLANVQQQKTATQYINGIVSTVVVYVQTLLQWQLVLILNIGLMKHALVSAREQNQQDVQVVRNGMKTNVNAIVNLSSHAQELRNSIPSLVPVDVQMLNQNIVQDHQHGLIPLALAAVHQMELALVLQHKFTTIKHVVAVVLTLQK